VVLHFDLTFPRHVITYDHDHDHAPNGSPFSDLRYLLQP
jgi:hypothetical protein